MRIPFNIPYLTGKEGDYIQEALESKRHCGNHGFARKAIAHMQEKHGLGEVFLTPSGTSALEMGALLANLEEGDEVIVPSYTFSSTVNALVLRNAKPVFCEIDQLTMNIDVTKIEDLITPKTKLIVPIDYAGIPCEIDKVMEIAKKHDLLVMHDTAQSYGSYYKGKATGAWADFATFSFHETKNITCGEGGALVINNPKFVQRAHFLQEKGTDRSLVLSGVKSKYHWVDLGSSFLLADILSAQLYAQMEAEDDIFAKRKVVFDAYTELYTPYEDKGDLVIPHLNDDMIVNYHAFWVVFDKAESRDKFIEQLKKDEVFAYIGYMPLHSAPMGQRYGYKADSLPITEDIASRLVRLPLYADLATEGLEHCINSMKKVLEKLYD